MPEQNQPSEYELLLACYLSGQMSEKQWQEHQEEDDDFREWVRRSRRGDLT